MVILHWTFSESGADMDLFPILLSLRVTSLYLSAMMSPGFLQFVGPPGILSAPAGTVQRALALPRQHAVCRVPAGLLQLGGRGGRDHGHATVPMTA